MTVTITRLYDSYVSALQAVRDLEAAGVPHKDISIVASNADNWYSKDRGVNPDRADPASKGAGTGAGIGGAVGGLAGLLAGLGMLAIPGVGPVVAAGWLVATAAGAATGAAAGGLIGGLTGAGMREEDAHVYSEGVRRGGTVVSARVPDADRPRLEGVLGRHSPVDIQQRGQAYRQAGWQRFDENAPAYTSEQVARERELYRSRTGTR